ncbi:hypothetical protein BHE74_00028595 [Ensete ventricosum]|nr:hypothetical protein BHE74_00028595 [Ensete ventricosum]
MAGLQHLVLPFSTPSFGLPTSFPPIAYVVSHIPSFFLQRNFASLSKKQLTIAFLPTNKAIRPRPPSLFFPRKIAITWRTQEPPSIMAIKNNAVRVTARSWDDEMTTEEFKVWLKSFDTNKDGRISRDELRRAIRSIRVRFSGWKSKRGVEYADSNGDGFIDDGEIDNLLEFAQKSLGLKIVAY